MTQSPTKRNYLFDNLKALLIFCVVAPHFAKVSGNFRAGGPDGFFYLVCFSFIMQGFLFISGYFSKHVEKCHSSAFKSLLFPYLILMPVMYLIRLALFGHARFRIYLPTHSLWFLLVMFVYRFFLKDLIRIPSRILLPLSIASYFLSGCLPFLGDTLALGRIFSFFFFFLAGYYFQWEQIEKIRRVKKRYSICLLGILLLVSAFLTVKRPFSLELWYLKSSYFSAGETIFHGILIRLLMGVVSLCWLFVLINLMPDRKLWFSSVGRHTLTIFACHVPVRYLLKRTGLPGTGGWSAVLFSLLLAAVVTWIFSRSWISNGYTAFMDGLYQATFGKLHTWIENRKVSR